jgi:hypothetical protein
LISIFTSENVGKFLTKSNPIIRGVNPPCLMPIRVKDYLSGFESLVKQQRYLQAGSVTSLL